MNPLTTFFLLLGIGASVIVAQTATVYVDYTQVTLLSGGVNDCVSSPLASTCVGGIASALALERNFSNRGEVHVLFNEFDFQTAFVQMHPLGWGVNTLIYQQLGVTTYTCRPSLFTTSAQDYLTITNGTSFPLATNLVQSASGGFAFAIPYWVDPQTKIGYVRILNTNQPNSDDPVLSAIPALRILRQRTRFVVLLFDASDLVRNDYVVALANKIYVKGYDATLMPDVVIDYNQLVAPYRLNSTYVTGCVPSATVLCSVPITMDVSNPARSVAVSVGAPYQWSTTIPSSLKDATYLAQQASLLVQAKLAGSNDPLLGYSTVAMPLTRTGSIRMCMAGECPLGNFWTDGMRWQYKDTIAFTTSGGTRGPGWPAGPIHVSDLWASLPFANFLCRGTLMGVTIFEIFNASVFYAQFQSLSTPTGDHLLQTSGLRYTYNTRLPAAGRLIAIDVLNPTTQVWEPLQRLKLYSFASDGFTCAAFPAFTPLIQRKRFPGETWALLSTLVQDAQEEFVRDSSPYTPGVFGRQINATNATVPMNMVETIADCEVNMYWDPTLFTCFDCPVGQQQPNLGQTFCVPIVAKDSTGTIIAAVVVPLIVIIAAVGGGVLAYRQAQAKRLMRNVDYAPKEGLIAIMFTDIEASTKLWSNAPQSMSVALDYHHEQIRIAINDNQGYEVKTAGDSFMIAFPTVNAAVKAAIDMQRAFMNHAYPSAIDKVYAAKSEDELLAIVDEPLDVVTSSDPLWNGLRVRIGIHAGYPTVVFDDVAKGYDYYGPPVNVAARTEAVASGGQVCLTGETSDFVTDFSGMDRKEFGYFELKGVSEPVKIMQYLPVEYAARNFKDSGDEKVAKVGGDYDDTASMIGGSEDTAAAAANAEYTAFLRTLFKALTSGEKSNILKKLAKGWRIHVTNDDDATEAMAMRVGKAMTRERMRIERQREALGGSLGSARSGGLASAQSGAMASSANMATNPNHVTLDESM